jgi:hypothetical protein
MAIRTELSLRLQNSPGALGGICRLLAGEHVNIVAMSLEATGQLRLVVDNHVHGAALLRERHHKVTERSVVVLPLSNTPGALSVALELVADAGINIEYTYGGAPDSGIAASVVLGVDDAMRASAAAGI